MCIDQTLVWIYITTKNSATICNAMLFSLPPERSEERSWRRKCVLEFKWNEKVLFLTYAKKFLYRQFRRQFNRILIESITSSDQSIFKIFISNHLLQLFEHVSCHIKTKLAGDFHLFLVIFIDNKCISFRSSNRICMVYILPFLNLLYTLKDACVFNKIN